eukprot:gene12909-12724_t
MPLSFHPGRAAGGDREQGSPTPLEPVVPATDQPEVMGSEAGRGSETQSCPYWRPMLSSALPPDQFPPSSSLLKASPLSQPAVAQPDGPNPGSAQPKVNRTCSQNRISPLGGWGGLASGQQQPWGTALTKPATT